MLEPHRVARLEEGEVHWEGDDGCACGSCQFLRPVLAIVGLSECAVEHDGIAGLDDLFLHLPCRAILEDVLD